MINPHSQYTPERLIRYSIVVLYAVNILAGPLRYYLASSGLYALVYLPKIEIAGLTVFLILKRKLVSGQFILMVIVLAIFFLLGLLDLPSPEQPLFALWELVPFIFSLVVARDFYQNLEKYRIALFILFAIAVGGVLYNYFFDFPWSGQDIQFGGHEIEVSRKWGTAYFSRVSGFASASFDAAVQLMVFGIVLLQITKSRLIAAAIWILAGTGIVLTTTKGVILSFSICSIFAFLRFNGNFSSHLLRLLSWLAFCGFSVFFMLGMISLPFLSVIYHFQIGASSIITELLFLSFEDRLVITWPNALSHLHGLPSFLFGNGLGAIGAPQGLYDPGEFNPADNLFVFLLVQYGLLVSISLLIFFLLKVLRASWPNTAVPQRFMFQTLSLFLIVYGCTTNEIEDTILATILGFCIQFSRSFYPIEDAVLEVNGYSDTRVQTHNVHQTTAPTR
jgi:hypothetical protein